MTKPTKNHGFYSRHFTPEEIEMLNAISLEQYLTEMNCWILQEVADLLRQPGPEGKPGCSSLSARERILIARIISETARRLKQ
jgi:hypothetical protein